MEGSRRDSSTREKLFSLLKEDLSIEDPHEHFRTGIASEEDVCRRRHLFGSNHLEKPEHDWPDLISSVVEHHPIIWIHVVLGFLKFVLVSHETDRALTMGFCFVSTIAFIGMVVYSHVVAMDTDLEEAHHEIIEVIRASETHFIHSQDLVVGDVFMMREGSRAPCNCAVVRGRVKTKAEPKKPPPNHDKRHLIWRGTTVESGAGLSVAIVVGGHMTREEEEASFQNHHLKRNPLEHLQSSLLVVASVVFFIMHFYGVENILAHYIDIVLGFSFLSPLNLLSSKVASSEDEDILKVRQLCIDKSVVVDKLLAVKAIGGVGMLAELRDMELDLHQFVSQIPRAEGGPDPVICSIALNTTDSSDHSTVEGALLSMLQEWGFDPSTADSVRQQWAPHVISRRLFDPAQKLTSCLLATRSEEGSISGGVVFCLGAADVVLARCGHMHSPDGGDRLHPRLVNLQDIACLVADMIDPLSPADRRRLEVFNLGYCRESLTPMACAHRHVSALQTQAMLQREDWDDELDQDMTIDLIIGLTNNVNQKLFGQLKEFGLRLRIVTNDSLITAVHVANTCKLASQPIPTTVPTSVTGAYFRTRFSPLISWLSSSSSPLHLSSPLFSEVKDLKVLARATLEDKANLVRLLNQTQSTKLVTKCKRSGVMLDSAIHHHDLASLLDQLIRCYTNTDKDYRVARFQLSVLSSLFLLALKKVAFNVPVLVVLAMAVQLIGSVIQRETPRPRLALKRVKHFSDIHCAQRLAVEVCFEWFLLSVVELVANQVTEPIPSFKASHGSYMMFHTIVFCRLSGVIGLFIDHMDTCASELGPYIITTLLLLAVAQCQFLSTQLTPDELVAGSFIGSLSVLTAVLNRTLSTIEQPIDETQAHPRIGDSTATESSTPKKSMLEAQRRVAEAMLKLEASKCRHPRFMWEWLLVFVLALMPAYWLVAYLGTMLPCYF